MVTYVNLLRTFGLARAAYSRRRPGCQPWDARAFRAVLRQCAATATPPRRSVAAPLASRPSDDEDVGSSKPSSCSRCDRARPLRDARRACQAAFGAVARRARRAAENGLDLKAVFAQLERDRPAGLRYATSKLRRPASAWSTSPRSRRVMATNRCSRSRRSRSSRRSRIAATVAGHRRLNESGFDRLGR